MKEVNLFKLFNISVDSEDNEVEESHRKLIEKTVSDTERSDLLENFQLVFTKEKRYLYFLTSKTGFRDISDLDNEILSHPNYIGPGKWMELLE